MDGKVNTLIIGAGFSGLSAGIRLAQFQESVLIVEAHTVSGGLNSYYFRGSKEKIFSSGLHTVTNFRANNRKWGFGLICRNLGLEPEAFNLYPPKYKSRIIAPGQQLSFDNGFATFESEVAAAFPNEIDAFQRFIGDVKKVKPTPEAFQLKSREVLKRYFEDEDLMDLLELPVYIYGGYAEEQIDYVTFATVFRSIFIEGCGSPPTIKHILDLLIKRFKALGGQLKYRREVKRLVVKGNRVEAVELTNGDVLEVDYCVSSAGLTETGRLLGESWGEPGEISAFETLVDLPRPLDECGVKDTLLMVSKQPRFSWTLPPDRQSYYHLTLSAMDNYAFDFETPVHHLKIGCYQRGSLWQGLEDAHYQAEKAEMQVKLLAELKELFPELPFDELAYTESMTAKTVVRFTSHPNGIIYGGQIKTFDGRTPISNLFIVGNDQGGIGIMGTMTSGVLVANYQIILAK